MEKDVPVKLIVGSNLAQELCENEATELRSEIQKLRYESPNVIPLIHITDGIKIKDDSYEIQIDNKTILTKKVSGVEKNDLIKMIVEDLKVSLI